MAQEEKEMVFELGKITVEGKNVYVEEITVNTSQDLMEYYTTDSFTPKQVRPGRRKIDFTIRRARDLTPTGSTLLKLFTDTCAFPIVLFAIVEQKCGNFATKKVAVLQGCRISKFGLGNFDQSKPVQEDIEGKAELIKFFDKTGMEYAFPDTSKLGT
jgi:hypothetical protein